MRPERTPTVTTGAGAWQIVDSTFLTDAAATTNVAGGLTDVGTTSWPGQVKDAGSTTSAITLGLGQFTEIEYALQATASATPGGSYCFRLYDTTAARPLDGYAFYAQASLPTLDARESPVRARSATSSRPRRRSRPTLFQFRLSRSGTVTVDTLRVALHDRQRCRERRRHRGRAVGGHERERHLRRGRPRHAASGRRRGRRRRADVHQQLQPPHDRHQLLRARDGGEPRRRATRRRSR